MTPELIAQVRGNPGFAAFAALIGERIGNGRSIDALRMLQAIGATGAIAHAILEGWPRRCTGTLYLARTERFYRCASCEALDFNAEAPHACGRELNRRVPHGRAIGLTAEHEAAYRLATFVGNLYRHDWPSLLARAARAAQEGRAGPEDSRNPEQDGSRPTGT
jgi:hypothetical protein